MAVRFVLGRAGSGKTEHCFRAIVEAMRADPLGPPIYWLLPRQATFSAERDLTCRSGLGAFFRARVVSFEQFGRDVFEDCGGTSVPEVTALGRQMIIGHLLRQNRDRLRFYSRVAFQPGLAGELDATFAEFERSGKTAAELRQIIAELSESNAADLELAPLLDKLRDVRLLYDAYTTYLGQDRLDPHRRLMQVEASLSTCSFLKHATIYVDGFLDFTHYERRILVGAAKAGARIKVTLLIDPNSAVVADPHTLPHELGVFRRTEEAYRRMYFAFNEAGVTVDEPLRLETVSRFDEPALQEIERGLFRDPIEPQAGGEGIELVEAPDRACEVEALARGIRGLLMRGVRFREIGVLVRDLTHYQVLIRSSFGEHDIPFFLDRRRTAAHHPLLEFVRSLFQIARHDWPHDAVMSMLRGGLAGVTLYEADGLENYVLAHRIGGAAGWESAKPWDYQKRRFGAEDEAPAAPSERAKAESLRNVLVERLAPLLKVLRSGEPAPVRTYATEIFSALDRFGVRATIAQWITEATAGQELERAAEHEQVWLIFVDLFEQLVELLGDERMKPEEFHDVLEAGFESFDLAITPPTVDQVVVGQVDRTRTGALKAVFVLGLNEGEFPRAAADGSILTDRDRRNLRSRRIELDPGLQDRLLDERLLAYVAFTRASGRLLLSRCLAGDEGRETEPSAFWMRVSAMFPDAARRTLPPAHAPVPGDVATPRQLVTSLMRWVRAHADPLAGSDSACAALYQWLASRPASDDAVGRMRFGAWRALSYANGAELSKDVAAEIYKAPLEAGVSQLETFAACPFKHFLRYTLNLRDRDRQDVTVADLGRLYHELLETALKDVMRRRAAGDKTVRLEQVIEQFVVQVGSSLRDEIMMGSARNRYLLDRTVRTSRLIALAQRELLKRGSFRPGHLGVTFGGAGGQLPPLRVNTPAGEVLLRGKIDRVDRVDGCGDVAVIDYKMGPAKLPAGMVLHGLSLQLLSYLLVLEANGQQLCGRAVDPAAAFYLQLVRKIEDVKHPDDCVAPTDPTWHLKLKPRGLFDRRCLPALDKDLQPGWSQVVHAFLKQDGNLGRTGQTDVMESAEFRALLDLAARKLSEIGAGILAGRVDIAPYRLNDQSPCSRCDYASVCRFDPAVNRYNYLANLTRDEALGRGGAGAGGDDA